MANVQFNLTIHWPTFSMWLMMLIETEFSITSQRSWRFWGLFSEYLLGGTEINGTKKSYINLSSCHILWQSTCLACICFSTSWFLSLFSHVCPVANQNFGFKLAVRWGHVCMKRQNPFSFCQGSSQMLQLPCNLQRLACCFGWESHIGCKHEC